MRKSLFVFGPLLLAAAIPALAQQPAGKPAWGSFGVEFDSMDRAVHPGDVFWSYVIKVP